MTVHNLTRLFLLLLFFGVLPALLAASEETRPVAGGRRLKERAAKGAKNKKSKGDKSGKNEHQNIFNVDHEDACAPHKKKKGCRMHKECRWTKSHGCVKGSMLGQNQCTNPETCDSSYWCCYGYECRSASGNCVEIEEQWWRRWRR